MNSVFAQGSKVSVDPLKPPDKAAVDWREDLQDFHGMKKVDHQTLEQLAMDVWPVPDFASHLAATCHQLRKKQLCDFTVEDLRIMIGQGTGTQFLLPKAFEVTGGNPVADGDLHAGDLFLEVVRFV